MRYGQITISLVVVWLFVWLVGCPAPVMLPQLDCDGGRCISSEPAQKDESQVRESTQEVPAFEPPPIDASDHDVVASDIDRQDHHVSDMTVPVDAGVGEVSPSEEQPPDRRLAEKPPIEKPPVDRGPACIDNDKDGVCANVIRVGYQVDCDDDDSNVSPRQTGYFAVPSKNGSWDYDCSTKMERLYGVHSCSGSKNICTLVSKGFIVATPCGQRAAWSDGCMGSLGRCLPSTPKIVVQRCR